jgi:anti-anti-sigma factor
MGDGNPERTIAVVRLSGDQDFGARDELRAKLDGLQEADIAIIDLSAVRYADSTFMNGVANLYKRLLSRGTPFSIRLVGVSPQLRRIFRLTQLDRFVEFWDDLGEASNSGTVNSA